jgi:hypothetical protein
LHNIWSEPFGFTTCDGAIKSKGPHPSCEKYKRIISQISGTDCGMAGKSVTSGEYGDESLSQDRFNRKPVPLFAIAKEAQIQRSIQQR